jgi:hypothetical protein
MSEFAQRNVRTESSGSGPSTPRKGVEEATDDKTETRKDTRDTHSGDTELPRNENLRKTPMKPTATPRYRNARMTSSEPDLHA